MRLIDGEALVEHLNDFALSESPDESDNDYERVFSQITYNAIQKCIDVVENEITIVDVGEQRYREGMRDAYRLRESAVGCSGCEYGDVEAWELPCRECSRNSKDYWKAETEK